MFVPPPRGEDARPSSPGASTAAHPRSPRVLYRCVFDLRIGKHNGGVSVQPEPPRAEPLRSLPVAQLRRLCEALDADHAAAMDSDDPKESLVAVARARLDALPLKQLRKLTVDAGVDKEELMDALDESDDRKHTTLELLLRAIDEEPPTELGAEEGVPRSPTPPAEAPPPGAAAPAPPPSAWREPGGQNPMSDMDILMAFYEAREPEHADAAWIAKVVRRYQKKAAKINVRAPEGTKFPLPPPPPRPSPYWESQR